MSSKARSPGAYILRNSRFFSLPRPLPSPTNNLAGDVYTNRTSDTATLPYPIQQAIVTQSSSLARGDWGFKRSLPLKSTTNTSAPVLRINAVDTREHITDFDSAADLTMSLQKIQELCMPVTVSTRKYGSQSRDRQVSVFEPQFDNTDPKATMSDPDFELTGTSPQKQRWKFGGPWVAGMTPGDFEIYVAKELKERKPEFTSFLRERSRNQILRVRQSEARADGRVANENVTEQEVDNHIKTMRVEYDLNSPLARLIAEFLDLPDMHRSGSDFLDNYKSINEGPPMTHPSAGLSYLKSDAFLDNHPLFGPQADHAPIEARILGGQTRFERGAENGQIGVAGLVAKPPRGIGGRVRSIAALPDNSDAAEVKDRNGYSMGLATPGGNRIWVAPAKLEVDANGRAQLETTNPNNTAVGIHTGALKPPSLPTAPRRDALGLASRPSMHRLDRIVPTPRPQGNRNQYGIGPGRVDGTADLMKILTKQFAPESGD